MVIVIATLKTNSYLSCVLLDPSLSGRFVNEKLKGKYSVFSFTGTNVSCQAIQVREVSKMLVDVNIMSDTQFWATLMCSYDAHNYIMLQQSSFNILLVLRMGFKYYKRAF